MRMSQRQQELAKVILKDKDVEKELVVFYRSRRHEYDSQ